MKKYEIWKWIDADFYQFVRLLNAASSNLYEYPKFHCVRNSRKNIDLIQEFTRRGKSVMWRTIS